MEQDAALQNKSANVERVRLERDLKALESHTDQANSGKLEGVISTKFLPRKMAK